LRLHKSTVDSDPKLQTALNEYSATTFKDKWSYDYKTGKPLDFAMGKSDPLYKYNNHLCYFPSRSSMDTPPSSLGMYIENNIMGYVFHSKFDFRHTLSSKLNTQIGNADGLLSLPYGCISSNPFVVGLIKDDIIATFQDIVATSDSGQWNINYMDKDYELHKSSENPLRMNALVVHWYDSEDLTITHTDGLMETVTIEMIYLYFLGVGPYFLLS